MSHPIVSIGHEANSPPRSVLLAVGVSIVLAQLVTFPGMLFDGCTDDGVPEAQQQGVSLIGVVELDLLYTPDGTNECSIPLPAVLVPIGLIASGTGLVSDEVQFQKALEDLISEAESNGVDFEGEWAIRDGSASPDRGLEISEVKRSETEG